MANLKMKCDLGAFQISPHIKTLSSLFLSAVLRWSSVRRRGRNVRFAGGLTASKMRRLVAPFVCFAFFAAVSGKFVEDLISVVFKVMRTRCVWNKIRKKDCCCLKKEPTFRPLVILDHRSMASFWCVSSFGSRDQFHKSYGSSLNNISYRYDR